MEKICRLLPVMYMPMAFMGSCLAGPRASSQAFFTLSVSVSSGVGGFEGDGPEVLELDLEDLSRDLLVETDEGDV